MNDGYNVAQDNSLLLPIKLEREPEGEEAINLIIPLDPVAKQEGGIDATWNRCLPLSQKSVCMDVELDEPLEIVLSPEYINYDIRENTGRKQKKPFKLKVKVKDVVTDHHADSATTNIVDNNDILENIDVFLTEMQEERNNNINEEVDDCAAYIRDVIEHNISPPRKKVEVEGRGRKKPKGTFKCYQCNKKFNYKCNLQTHLVVHSNEKHFSCSICNKSFKLKGNLLTHRKVHDDRHEFQCDECGKEFKRRGNLKTHMKLKHFSKVYHHNTRNERNEDGEVTTTAFQCVECDKTFNHKCNLQIHAAVHSNEKAHTCSICKKSFKLKGHLNTHRKVVHNNYYEYKCKICGKEFKLKGNIKTHIKTKHLDQRLHKCTSCDKAFKLKQHLLNHSRIKHSIPEVFNTDVIYKV